MPVEVPKLRWGKPGRPPTRKKMLAQLVGALIIHQSKKQRSKEANHEQSTN